mmetsp:Transcript_3149/g.12058  ORF Transcript_3149/g.12058 Transcript_3149/m.12058 type:complete len:93 (+) Transcript_3149:1525-1803(+)
MPLGHHSHLAEDHLGIPPTCPSSLHPRRSVTRCVVPEMNMASALCLCLLSSSLVFLSLSSSPLACCVCQLSHNGTPSSMDGQVFHELSPDPL